MILYLIQKLPINGKHKHKRPCLTQCSRKYLPPRLLPWSRPEMPPLLEPVTSRLPLSWNWEVAIVLYICLTYVVLLFTSVTLYIMYIMYVYFRLSKTSLQVLQTTSGLPGYGVTTVILFRNVSVLIPKAKRTSLTRLVYPSEISQAQ
jgi:hypothetical protein